MFNKYIYSLMSIQRNCFIALGIWERSVAHPSHTHSSFRKGNNSDHRKLSLEHGPKSSNLKGYNKAILEANQCSQQIWTSTSAARSFAFDWRDATEHYLARTGNLYSDILLQEQGLSHHGDASGRRFRSL